MEGGRGHAHRPGGLGSDQPPARAGAPRPAGRHPCRSPVLGGTGSDAGIAALPCEQAADRPRLRRGSHVARPDRRAHHRQGGPADECSAHQQPGSKAVLEGRPRARRVLPHRPAARRADGHLRGLCHGSGRVPGHEACARHGGVRLRQLAAGGAGHGAHRKRVLHRRQRPRNAGATWSEPRH